MPTPPDTAGVTDPGDPNPSAAGAAAAPAAAERPEPPVDPDLGAPSVALDEGVAPAPEPAPEPAPAPTPAPEMTAAACAARLAELFPALFGTQGPPRPVKLRVHADVQQRAPGVFTRRVLSAFLARHTTTSAYLRGLVESPHRFDLDGQPAGEIAEEHRAAAREELARRRALRRGPPARSPRQDAPAAPPSGPVDAAGPAPAAQRPARPPRPEMAERPPRPPRPPRPGGSARGPARGPQRPPREPGPARAEREGPATRPATPPEAEHRRQPPAAPVPFDPAQRARQTLVRAWESSPLTKPNFCVLMRVTAAELDAAIEQVQQERRARTDTRHDTRHDARPSR